MILVIALITWLFPTKERVIRKRLASLAQTVSIQPGQSQLARLANASKVVDFFTPDVTLEITGLDFSINGRNDLREVMLGAQASVRRADVRFDVFDLVFPQESNLVTAYLMAVARFEGETNSFARELKMTLRKIEGKWLVSRVESAGL